MGSTPALKFLYVEIPPSPLHSKHRRTSIPSLPSRLSFSSTVNLKENTPLRPPITTHADSQAIKRKSDSTSTQPSSKKPRVEGPVGTMAQGKLSTDDTLINCHQCKNKRDPSDVVQCTFHLCKKSTKTAPQRCTLKYCRNCLKKRYNEDLDHIITTTRGQKENGHAQDTYVFKCPKCRGQCACWFCKNRLATQAAAALVKETMIKEAPVQAQTTAPRATNVGRPPKPLVLPSWSTIPTQLSLKDAEDRILIREFVQRFSNLQGMSVSKAQLRELEFIGGMHDTDNSDVDNVYSEWVSEACVRSLVLSLIGVLAAEEDSSATLVMKNAMKDIRKSGVNMTKIWGVLSTLRTSLGPPEKPETNEVEDDDKNGDDESSEDRVILEYPDPSPPPANHSVRSTRFSTDALPVVHTAQMIPVILGLIQTVLESHAVRTELDEGTKEGREKVKESRECIKLANESWEQQKKSLEEAQEPETKIKTERQVHKLKVQGLENAAKVISSAFVPRSTPLGTDQDGRVYWALTPSVYDRDYALDYITSRLPQPPKSKKPRNRKHRQRKEDEDRKAFKEWTWFLAVWGNKPGAKDVASSAADEPQWWGFWDPVEIRRLAEWINVTNDLKKTTDNSRSPVVSRTLDGLVKNITEYAALLEWRAQGEEE